MPVFEFPSLSVLTQPAATGIWFHCIGAEGFCYTGSPLVGNRVFFTFSVQDYRLRQAMTVTIF